MSFDSDSSFCLPHSCTQVFQGDLPIRDIRKEAFMSLALTVSLKYHN